MTASEMYDVAVVGFGPAGEVAAATLGSAGHSVLVVERQRELYPLPRMATFDGESCRTVQATGTSVDKALEHAAVLPVCNFDDADQNALLAIDWAGTQSGFRAHYSVFQPDVEQVLQDRVEELAGVEIRRGTEVIGLVQHADHVELTVRPKGSTDASQAGTVRARYVVGADGTNSYVRDSVGITMHDYDLHERWLNFDMNKLGDLPSRFDDIHLIMDPKRPHMYMPLGSKRTRFELRIAEDEPDGVWLEPESAWTFLREMHGLGTEELSICRQVIYHFYTRVADRWRDNRVFIAGDAAHTMTPYMGQGGCSAIRDGRSIGWKLSLVLQGLAGEDLLDSYQDERQPHVTQLVMTSDLFSRMINEVDPVKAAERDHALKNHLAPPPPPFPKLEHGVLHREADGSIAPVTGSLAPQGTLRKGSEEGRGDDLLGHGFQLVSRTAPELTSGQRRVLEAIGCTVAVLEDAADPDSVTDVDGVYGQFLDAHEADAYLMRPDWYVFGIAATPAVGSLVDELGALLHLRADSSHALSNA